LNENSCLGDDDTESHRAKAKAAAHSPARLFSYANKRTSTGRARAHTRGAHTHEERPADVRITGVEGWAGAGPVLGPGLGRGKIGPCPVRRETPPGPRPSSKKIRGRAVKKPVLPRPDVRCRGTSKRNAILGTAGNNLYP
jgi:hypothetical protein